VANVLFDLIQAPNLHKKNIPSTPRHDSPARRLTPPPMPRFMNIGLENSTQAAAKRLLDRSFAAKSDAAYLG